MSAELARTVADTGVKAEIVPAPAPTAVMGETAAILTLIERAARDPAVDLDKMERLFAMQERAVAQQAERAFNEAMGKAQAELPQVLRDAQNDHTKSKYARLETINKAITPVITKHGFSLSFGTEESPLANHYRLTCVVAHSGGHSRREHTDLPADVAGSQGKANKTAIQGFGSTISYGRRYLTLLIFNVALTNEDNDGNSVARSDDIGTISEDQATVLRDLIRDVGSTEARFIKHINVERLEDIFTDKFDAVVALLETKRARR